MKPEHLLVIGDSLLTVVIAFLFFSSFKQRATPKKYVIIARIVSFCIVLIAKFVFGADPFSYLMVFSACVVLSFPYFLNLLHGVFYSCIFTVLILVVETTASVLLKTSFGDAERISFFTVLASKALLFLIIHIIYVLKYKPFSREADKKYLIVMAFPIASVLAIITQNALVLQNEHWAPVIVGLVLISDFALLFATMVVFEYTNSLYDLAMHKSKIEHANKIIEIQAMQYRSMMENSFETNKIKHDLRNFCIGIAAELKQGNTETAIEKLCSVYGEDSPLKDNSDSAVEFILSAKAEKAAAVGVKLIWECVTPQGIKVSDVDLAIILGNAIDNAVEAAEKTPNKGTVEVFILPRNNLLVIKIKNPVNGFVDVNDLSSTKSDKSSHGFGIISMKQLVEKYDGEIVFTLNEGVFTTRIIMKNSLSKTQTVF